jgi:2-polyprenyl-3-methyl-5-hydroxy-6-metoxy-1,4-benzoquinol methylase
MNEYWNERFINEQFIWGIEPSEICSICDKYYNEYKVKNILIMGVGYGRNGKYFINKNYNVDGIEISEEAIRLGKKFEPKIKYIKGSVLDINIEEKYDGVFCYDLLHLFIKSDRETIIEKAIDCCKTNGIIMFSCFSVNDKTYRNGKEIEYNTYEVKKNKTVHFYDKESMETINKRLEPIEINEICDKIETENRKEEYELVYGIYKKK